MNRYCRRASGIQGLSLSSLLILILGLGACTSSPEVDVITDLQTLLDEAGMTGNLLIYDETADQYYSNDSKTYQDRNLPASTFKIVNAIIGIETGTVEPSTVFKWDGQERPMQSWNKDLSLAEAFQVSCVPCFRDLARRIGIAQMQDYVAQLGFGAMDVQADNLDLFWLEGESRISPWQQVDFLRRLWAGDLPIRASTREAIIDMMKIPTGPKYKMYGKTGLATRVSPWVGWFVGWVERDQRRYFFATMISPSEEVSRGRLMRLRRQLTKRAVDRIAGAD